MKKTKKNNNYNFLKNWLPVFLWAAIIFYFSAFKQPKVSEFFIWDYVVKKIAHITEYAILYTLIYRATKRNLILAYIITISYAATDEFHQSFVLGRTATPLDLGFDASGANIATYLLWKLKQIRRKKARK
ncbi:MAG: VanZ family protein [Patescibacteria group bacterium]